jgi:hypothetical protein
LEKILLHGPNIALYYPQVSHQRELDDSSILSHEDVEKYSGRMEPSERGALAAEDERRRLQGFQTASEEALQRHVNPWIEYDV